MAELFGFNPSDWLDEGFNVELRFAAPPDEALLTRLGKAAGSFRGGSLGFAFTGPFAVVSLLPHPGRERAALDELAAICKRSTAKTTVIVFRNIDMEANAKRLLSLLGLDEA